MNNTIRWLWNVTGKKKGYILVLALLQAVSGGTGVLYALQLRNIVDSATGKNTDAFRQNIILIIGLVIVQLAVSAIIRRIHELARADIENAFKQRLLSNILRKNYSAVSAVHTAEWVNRLTNDTTVVANGVVEILPGLIGTVVRLVSALIMIIALDRWFAYILIPGGLALAGLTYAFRKVLKQLHKNIQESDGRLRIFFQEHIANLMLIKSFAAEGQTERQAAEKMTEHKAARMKRNNFSNIANIGFGAAMQGMYLIGAVYCAYRILHGTVTFGTLTAVMQLIGQVQGPFANISGYLPRWYAMTASAERLMDAETFADDGKARSEEEIRRFYRDSFASIVLHDIAFTYETEDKSPVVLKDFSLEIHKGETVAFTGHSDCGKSTVLKLLMTMYPPDAGKLSLLSSDGETPLDASWRRLFAYVPQGNALMTGTIREVVSFAEPEAAGDENRLKHALQVACADEFVTAPDAVYQEAEWHMLDAAAAMALESAGMHDERSSMCIARSLRKTALFDREKKAVLEKMEQNGIWYMSLKGALVKDLYPKYGMREFSDHDILFDPVRRNDVREIMLGLEFTEGKEKDGIHDHYYKNPVLNFEMHWILFGTAFDRTIAAYYSNVKEWLIKDPENQFGWHFTPEDFYVFILAHAYKHYSTAGTGLRSLLDVYVILKETSPDMEKISAELEKLGISEFESQFRSLSLDLFSGKELTEDEMEMFAYIVSSGTYGTIQNSVVNSINKVGGGKIGKRRYIFNRIFPTMEEIEKWNPFFYRHKILLPFLLPYRLLRGVFKRRARLTAEMKALRKF